MVTRGYSRRICKDRDVLKAYLEEKEAAEIMFTWLDEQKAKKFEEEEIRQAEEQVRDGDGGRPFLYKTCF